jgi:hypothetical protein
MYNLTVYNRDLGVWVEYNVDNSIYTPVGYEWVTREKETPKNKYTVEVYKGKTKDPIYKREMFQCTKDRYDYQFTERETVTTDVVRDVYYNKQKDRFLTKEQKTKSVRTEYSLPRLIVF